MFCSFVFYVDIDGTWYRLKFIYVKFAKMRVLRPIGLFPQLEGLPAKLFQQQTQAYFHMQDFN